MNLNDRDSLIFTAEQGREAQELLEQPAFIRSTNRMTSELTKTLLGLDADQRTEFVQIQAKRACMQDMLSLLQLDVANGERAKAVLDGETIGGNGLL